MKTKISIILVSISLHLCDYLMAQHIKECATDLIDTYLSNTYNNYRHESQSLDRYLQGKLRSRIGAEDTSEIYTIPVVVHVIHKGEAVGVGSNISDEQIRDAILGLNEQFSNTNGKGIDTRIRFKLAVRNPDGCVSNGINRADGSNVDFYKTNGIEFSNNGGADERELKSLSIWPKQDYYNIWVVHKIYGDYAGYAYYPTSYSYDGAVIYHARMTRKAAVLSHELGHSLYLKHTFEGGNNSVCPPNVDCLIDGDGVCDTPPHKPMDCGGSNSCPSDELWTESLYNYLSYCPRKNRFTKGQRDRMRAVLSTHSSRASLLTSLGKEETDFKVEIEQENDESYMGNQTGIIKLNVTGGSFPYHYAWSNNIHGFSNTLSNLVPGFYAVTITDYKKCVFELDSIPVNIKKLNSLNDESDFDRIYVFPNPAHQVLNIRFKNYENRDIGVRMYTSTGKLIQSDRINYNSKNFIHTINVSQYSNQVYLLKISLEGKFYNYKIAIVK